MKNSKQQSNDSKIQLTTEINNYEYACNNIVVFELIFSEIVNAKTHQARKFKPSLKNKITQEEVAPDVSFEEKGTRSGKYRAVNEIKAWLPLKKDQWMDVVEQLQSYDDDLTNWEFSGNETHDIMLTIDPRFTKPFQDYLEKLREKGEGEINRNFAIIQSSRQERALPSIFVKKDFGVLGHVKLDTEISNGISKTMHNIVRDLDKVKFYDVKPPTIYIMMQMWDHVFSKYINSREKKAKLDAGQIVTLDLEIKKIHEQLSKLTHDSNPNCLKSSWIKNALFEFELIGLAKASMDGNKFSIKYRKHDGFTDEFLLNLMKKKEDEKVKPDKDGLDKFIGKKEEQT